MISPEAGKIPSWSNPGDERIKDILEKARTIAIVGLTSKSDRPSHGVASFLKDKGYRIIPVNPGEDTILGEKSYPDLKSIPDKVDVVEVFRRPEHAPDIVEEAADREFPVVWLQEDIYSDEAARIATKHGLLLIMDRCMAKEYKRLMT